MRPPYPHRRTFSLGTLTDRRQVGGNLNPLSESILSNTLFLAGPTAAGKTEVALAVAEACNGEIVGADAFQVYAGLDLLTAKPSAAELARAPHHLIGVVPLSEAFNVARYVECAQRAIAEIQMRGRLPIVVGGTGLYIRALTRGLADTPPSDPALRTELAAASLPQLLNRLDALDPAAGAAVDRNNPRRVIRALEVVLLTGKPFASFREEWSKVSAFRGFLLGRERDELYARIDRRTAALFERGAVEEVRAALEAGPVSETAQQVLGWKPICALLRGKLSRAGCLAAMQQATRKYAKRQLTWFRREPMLTPVVLTAAADNIPSIIQAAAAVGASVAGVALSESGAIRPAYPVLKPSQPVGATACCASSLRR